MRVAFFGTPDVAGVALRALLDSPHEIVVVVTQPDRARGRGRGVMPSPVKLLASEHDIPILQPESPKGEGFPGELRTFSPDALVVVAYGHILPRSVLEVAPAMNAHFSLLPRYRGAAPVQRALMDGATETGVSVFLLEPTVDTGPVVARESVPIAPGETAGELLERLAPIGARLVVTCLDGLETGTLSPVEQDDTEASPAPKIKPEEAEVVWTNRAEEIVNRVRALAPRPGAHTTFRGRRLVIGRAETVDGAGEPGAILDPRELVVAAGAGAVRLVEVTPEGKRPMGGADFARGARPSLGERLGPPHAVG